MDEYIKRESAIKSLLNDSPEQVSYSREDAADCIRYMDAADVAPVRHGRWIWNEEGEIDWEQLYRCSNCGNKEYWESNFCPNCGAKMDGGDGNSDMA